MDCTIFISGSDFTSNGDRAVNVQAENLHLAVDNSNFTGSKTILSGGAINFVTSISPDTWQLCVNITKSRFHANSANNFGGVLHLSNTDPDRPYVCNIVSSVFTQNLVGNQGGALSIRQSNVSVIDSVFADNQAMWNDSSAAAIALSGVCNLPVLSNHNNYASGQLQSSIFGCIFSIANSTFTRNSALLTGGAIYAVLDGFIFSISQSHFVDNQLLAQGATIKADESLAARCSGGGTAIGVYPYTQGVGLSRLVIISQTTFSGNSGSSTRNPQAALAMQQLACLAIQDSTFDNNSAVSAGALYVDVVDGVSDLCSGNAESLPLLPGLVLYGPPLFDPFLTKPDHKPDPDTSAPPVPYLALTVDIRRTSFSNNRAINGNAGMSVIANCMCVSYYVCVLLL